MYREDPPAEEEIGNGQVKNRPHKRPRNPDAIMKANEVLKDQNSKKV